MMVREGKIGDRTLIFYEEAGEPFVQSHLKQGNRCIERVLGLRER